MSPLEDDIPLLTIDMQAHKDTSKNDDSVALPQSFQQPTLTEFLRTQASDTYSRMGWSQVGHTNFEITGNTVGLLIRRSRIDGALKTVVSPSLCQRSIIPLHHPPIAGHAR